MKPKKKIGILGGAGPAATAKFFSSIIDISQKKYKAEQDTDFPVVYLYNMPMEGFNETGFEDQELVKKQLIKGVRELENWGADFIVLPCNTVHYFIEDMRKAIKTPIVSIIDVTVNRIKNNKHKRVGILSSASTRNLELYNNLFEKNNISTLTAKDQEQEVLDNAILAVMSGSQSIKEKKLIINVINRMKEDGAEAIILGCTELPMAIDQTDTMTPLANSIDILAENAVDESYK